MIEVKQLWKNFGNTQVLERVNTVINEGDFVALVGTSGCGKSTFLRILLGVESVSNGAILINGKPIPTEPGPDRGIVFQHYSVFPHMTVLQNVVAATGLRRPGMTGKLFGTSKKTAIDESHGMLEKVGLSHVVDSYPHELSGGMQQRLAIAQTLMGKPRVLLLDEPFAALDPGIRSDMHELLLTLWQERALTVVMVTHSLAEGFALATRVMVFDKIRHDPHDPNAYGATITYDLETGDDKR
ncbi:MAG: ABC transporter ATP-binding protein [Granulosicoccus sp.]|nr:ABC transporter ATP-binding protein [Granulosicoccus sp.]